MTSQLLLLLVSARVAGEAYDHAYVRRCLLLIDSVTAFTDKAKDGREGFSCSDFTGSFGFCAHMCTRLGQVLDCACTSGSTFDCLAMALSTSRKSACLD